MVTKDMEITTCIEVITSMDAWYFCPPSIQWKFPLDTYTSTADSDSMSFFQCVYETTEVRVKKKLCDLEAKLSDLNCQG
jgi:hypothetical protein